MKILYLLQDFPYPPTNGVRIKVFNLIKYLVEEHECHLLCFGGENVHARAGEFRREVLPSVTILGLFPRRSGLVLLLARARRLLHRDPFFLARWESQAFAEAVKEALDSTDYDLVHLDALGMAPYSAYCLKLPKILSTTDAVSLAYRRRAQITSKPFLRLYLWWASRAIARFERKILPRFEKVHVVSHVDNEYLRSRVEGLDVETIGTMINNRLLEYPLGANPINLSGQLHVLFSGSLGTEKIAKGLLLFLSNEFSKVLNIYPDLQLTVLGRGAPYQMRKQIENTPNVRFVESVEDYSAMVASAQVVIFPDISGTGIKTRVLFAMALGRPIVASPSALEGIAAENGIHCFRRNVGNGFAEAIIALLTNPDLARKMGIAARQLIQAQYSSDVLGPKWLELYRQAIEKFHRFA